MQLTFGDAEGLGKRKQTRREIFLAEMEQVVPWQHLLGLIAPHYPVSGRPGRQPYALATMLRIHLLQQWYALSDPAMEEALHEIPTLRRFVRLGGLDNVPDETTILNFRRLLETHDLAARMLEAVNAHLARKGQSLRSGTIVDATLIAAPSSTKNADHARDPEMHQTKKGNQWYFGMKAHIGMDEFSGLVHHVRCTAANVADVTVMHALLHGKEDSVFGDSGYTGAAKREELQTCKAAFFIAGRPSTMQAIGNKRERAREQRWEHFKASMIEIALQAGSNEPMISEACWLRRSSRLIVLGARATAPAIARIDIQISYNACRRYRSARSRRRDDMGNSTWR